MLDKDKQNPLSEFYERKNWKEHVILWGNKEPCKKYSKIWFCTWRDFLENKQKHYLKNTTRLKKKKSRIREKYWFFANLFQFFRKFNCKRHQFPKSTPNFVFKLACVSIWAQTKYFFTNFSNRILWFLIPCNYFKI